jgi:hypothetical protein
MYTTKEHREFRPKTFHDIHDTKLLLLLVLEKSWLKAKEEKL